MKSLIILGRQPAIGTAEIESFISPKLIKPLKTGALIVDIEPSQIPFYRLGGSVKLAKIVAELHTANWREIEQYLAKTLPGMIEFAPAGKINIGISSYNLKTNNKAINSTALRLKKLIKSTGRSVRIIPNKSPALNSAQVIHNNLTQGKGIELVLYGNGSKTILAQTIAEQEIEDYAKRDQIRPKRDAKVGMLPPKLAQILINLATGEQNSTDSIIFSQRLTRKVLDPFCGTGVILQETLLMGYDAYGSDIDKRMIEYSDENIKWLFQTYVPTMRQRPNEMLPSSDISLEIADATKHTWQGFDVVACETYLGRPLNSLPPKAVLDPIIEECEIIHQKFLNNIASQLDKGARLALSVPAWKTKNGFIHLKTLDNLAKLGYNRIKFVHARNEDLIYHRPDQTVARELVILERK